MLRCSALAAPLPWRRGGTRPGRGVGRPWGRARRCILSPPFPFSSLLFLLSIVFLLPSFSLFSPFMPISFPRLSLPRGFFFSSAASTFFLFISPSVSPLRCLHGACPQAEGREEVWYVCSPPSHPAHTYWCSLGWIPPSLMFSLPLTWAFGQHFVAELFFFIFSAKGFTHRVPAVLFP